MHRANVGRRAPANGQNRQCSHAVSQRRLAKCTSPTFARSHWKRVEGREETYADALNEAESSGLYPGLAEERAVFRA